MRSLFIIGCMSMTLIVSAGDAQSHRIEVRNYYNQWDHEPDDEPETPTRGEVLGSKALMCVMTGTCLSVFLWALITRNIRA